MGGCPTGTVPGSFQRGLAATFGLITSVSQLGGFTGPYVIGFLNDRTHSLTAGFGFIALAMLRRAARFLV
jgi:ACS family tartrate transporter-like MFS transporter